MIPLIFEVWSPDEVAECMNGILSVDGLYQALWGLTHHYENQPRSEVNDDFTCRCLKNWWHELSATHQAALIAIAEQHEKEMAAYVLKR